MIEIINGLTVLWIAGWAWYAIRKLGRGRRDSILFIIPVFFLCCGFPLLLDLMVGKPQYSWQPGFSMATRDKTTCLIYCLYISSIPPFWWHFARCKRIQDLAKKSFSAAQERIVKIVLYALVVLPFAITVFAPDPTYYLTYAAVVQSRLDVETDSMFHSVLSASCILSVFAVSALLLLKKRLRFWHIMAALPWLLVADWINGKRAVVALTIFALVYVFWDKGLVKRRHIIAVLATAVVLISIFSFSYQSSVRSGGSSANSFNDIYDGARIDFCRDAAIKMTIFGELYPEQLRILEYRGQSLIFYLTLYVPRDKWLDKPMPYSRYFTSAMLCIPPTMLGWSMTTSCLEEPVANFGWIGLLIGPSIIAVICRMGDARRIPVISLLTILLSLLFLTVQFVSFAPLCYLWLAAVLYTKQSRKRSRYIPYQNDSISLRTCHLPVQ